MLDYEKLYRILFNGITDALDSFEKEGYARAKETLVRAQQAAEDYYIDAEENGPAVPVYILPHDVYTGENRKNEKPFGRLL